MRIHSIRLLVLSLSGLLLGTGLLMGYYVAMTPVGAEWAIRKALAGRVAAITIRRTTGNLASGLSLSGVEIRQPQGLPPGSVVDVQQLELGWPLSFRNIRAIRNGRVHLRYSDPVVFFGSQQDGQIHLQVYARRLDVPELLQAAGQSKLRRVRGAVDAVDVSISGPVHEPFVDGRFMVEELSFRNRALVRCPGTVKMRVSMPQESVRLDGAVSVAGGELRLSPTTVRLHRSRIEFAGDPAKPSLNLKGSAKVDQTTVHIIVKGRFAKPDVMLKSFPPLPQDRLLLMLATGKSWRSAETSLQQHQLSPDLAKDFLDFVVFGGHASKMARRIGISDLSLRYDPEKKGMGVTTVFFDRIGASYDVELAPEDQRDPAVQKLGAEYTLTDATALAVEGTRELSQSRRPASQVPGASPAIDENVIEKLLLKYKFNFW